MNSEELHLVHSGKVHLVAGVQGKTQDINCILIVAFQDVIQ